MNKRYLEAIKKAGAPQDMAILFVTMWASEHPRDPGANILAGDDVRERFPKLVNWLTEVFEEVEKYNA